MRPLTWRLSGVRGRGPAARPLPPITIGRYRGGFTLNVEQATSRALLAPALSITGKEDIDTGSLELTVRNAAGKVLTTIRSNAAGLTIEEAADLQRTAGADLHARRESRCDDDTQRVANVAIVT